MVIVTTKWLESIGYGGRLNKEQVILLGLSYPLPSGWKWSLIGQELSDERAMAIEAAKGPGDKKRKVENFHNGHYKNEELFGKSFHTIYTRPNIEHGWVWSHSHPDTWPTSFKVNEKGEVIF